MINEVLDVIKLIENSPFSNLALEVSEDGEIGYFQNGKWVFLASLAEDESSDVFGEYVTNSALLAKILKPFIDNYLAMAGASAMLGILLKQVEDLYADGQDIDVPLRTIHELFNTGYVRRDNDEKFYIDFGVEGD